MFPADNKTVVRQYAENVWNQGHTTAVETYISQAYVRHDPGLPMMVRGVDGIKHLVTLYRNAFPDLHFVAEDMIAEGDKVVVRWAVTGTHQGELMSIAPTGRRLRLQAIEVYRIADTKIVEQWVQLDNLGMLQQLGVIPAGGQA